MKKRQKMNRRKSKRLFTKTAKRSHRKNRLTGGASMRGGIRL
jgi:hypothetical protein